MTTKALIPTDPKELALQIAEERRMLISETEREDQGAFTVKPPRYKLISAAQCFQQTLTDEKTDTITGVIVASRIVRALWPAESNGDARQPICSSIDGTTGMLPEPDDESAAAFIDIADPDMRLNLNPFEPMACAKCPLNKWGSGKFGRGKACKEMRRLLLWVQGSTLPAILSVPPSSVGNFDDYATGQKTKGENYFSVVTEIAAAKAKNPDGIEYSKIEFRAAGALEVEHLREALEFRKQYESLARQRIESDDYETGEA